MFGPDTALMFDAMQMSAVVAGVTGAAVYFAMRWRRTSKNRKVIDRSEGMNLEERVRVLERIATDRSIDLAEEIEALREPAAKPKLGGNQ
ncbi:hypothetical protein NAP1_09047 [Erythrobacter sp. NAP1]|uniref:hypothetical protein n=1 Tax=Erythrobacter sp. NAP1 TaxID=237727 RepID=UPI0000685216|nr:hypothetical protein [Erythrobacter sp. NAP1]EAQ27728.1 hypothetical protein NAP1_09047 [Erythrobacter sp. NAP1]